MGIALSGCSSYQLGNDAPPAFLLFGEQHDQLDQKNQVAQAVAQQAQAHKLRAIVLEMAERGRSTAGLPPHAAEEDVQQQLHWQETGWPWLSYRSVVMTAVREGIPVVGGNLPKIEQKIAASESRLDDLVSPQAHALIADAISTSHCRSLPPEAVTRMVRIQIARDDTMAQTLMAEAQPGPVLLLAGEQHVARDRGVPQHLMRRGVTPSDIHSVGFNESDVPLDERRPASVTSRPDPCAE
jgi:uncharacterized iron-regulated protein